MAFTSNLRKLSSRPEFCKLICRQLSYRKLQQSRSSLFLHLDQFSLSQSESIQNSRSCLLPLRPFSTSGALQLEQTRERANPENSTSKILYDGDCRICQVEISALKKFTRKKNNLEFVDISSPDYDPKTWGGVSYEDAMKEMHVVGADGKVYTQAAAIRHMYKVCGLGWLASLTELPVIKPVCDKLYMRFAEYRLIKALDRCDSNSCDIKLKNLRDKLAKEKGLL